MEADLFEQKQLSLVFGFGHMFRQPILDADGNVDIAAEAAKRREENESSIEDKKEM